MDVNGTKFHLLLNSTDWRNCISSGRNFDWNEETSEITLKARLFKFTASPKDDKPNLENRRGAARDRYGNWFWIDETGLNIKILSVGSNRVSLFYPVKRDICAAEKRSDFQPFETVRQMPVSLRGLAVTIDHYLVVGTIEPAGLLVFDLFSTGEPRRILWCNDIEFAPFDIAARHCGGVFVLDRDNKRYWTLGRSFNAVGGKASEADETAAAFQPIDESEKRKLGQKLSAENFYSELPHDDDPISIEALPDDTVLILNLAKPREDFSIIKRYFREQKVGELKTDSILAQIDEDNRADLPLKERFRLRGFDIAFVEADERERKPDQLFIVSEEGNQAFSFRLAATDDLNISPFPDVSPNVVKKNFELQPINDYFPMRLFGGKGFTAADGKVYFDFGTRWLELIKQNRPSFVSQETLETPIFDGKEPNCVWHRLMLDGCISSETKIEIYSRTAAEKDEMPLDWQKEPNLYLRGNGSELPFVRGNTAKEKGKGTWELLLQHAKNRYLQLRLDFSGNERSTPRVSALRVYYPRFSYLDNYLPSIYREDEQSAFFLDRFLANFEGFYTTIEERIAAAQTLFDVRSAPPDALDWLANWFNIILDPNWTDEKRRLFISRAVDFFQYRGTLRGLRIALRLVLDDFADESIFETQTAEEKRRDPIRIVERFLTRRTPEIIPADSVEHQNLPRVSAKTVKWNPNQGADVLNQRYGEKFENQPRLKFPLIKPSAEEAQIWEQFAVESLGFVPEHAAAVEQKQWQDFLRDIYRNEIAELNLAQSTNFLEFEEIFLPRGTETNADLQTAWQKFVAETTDSSRNRKLWQNFLARRYRRIGQLNQFYATNWSSFENVSLFDQLPLADKSLADWFQFESVVLAMQRTAHRFTVLIPAVFGDGGLDTTEEQNRKLELVRRVVELEKPAHTVCDFRFYWNLFRLDEVRLGFDTLLGLGSRDPQLNPALVLGQNYIGMSRLGVPQPEKYQERYVLGSEAIRFD